MNLFSRRRSEHADRNVELTQTVRLRTTQLIEIIITWCYRKPFHVIWDESPYFKEKGSDCFVQTYQAICCLLFASCILNHRFTSQRVRLKSQRRKKLWNRIVRHRTIIFQTELIQFVLQYVAPQQSTSIASGRIANLIDCVQASFMTGCRFGFVLPRWLAGRSC